MWCVQVPHQKVRSSDQRRALCPIPHAPSAPWPVMFRTSGVAPLRSCLHPLRPPSSSDGPLPPASAHEMHPGTPLCLPSHPRGRPAWSSRQAWGRETRPSRASPCASPGGSLAAVGCRQSVWVPRGMRGWLLFVCLFSCLVIKTFIWPSKRNLICSVSERLIVTPRRRATGPRAGTGASRRAWRLRIRPWGADQSQGALTAHQRVT